MRRSRLIAILVLPLLLSGCLEVRQHPAWRDGKYAGKADDRQSHRLFHDDKLAWFAAVQDRMQNQNEYNRANP